jgi:aspartate racemase
MHIIYNNVKAGVPVEMDKFRKASKELSDRGAQVIILGCTELSLIKRDSDIGSGYIDAMEVLARVSVCECGGRLKKEYQSLI